MTFKSDVTYIVPCLNAAHLCNSFIEGWASQLAKPLPKDVSISFRFVDGGSTDDTRVRLEQGLSHKLFNSSIKVVPGCSIYEAWNICIEEIIQDGSDTSHTWLGFIGLDDYPRDLNALSFLPSLERRYNYVSFQQPGSKVDLSAFSQDTLRLSGQRFCHAGSLHRLDLFDDGNRFTDVYRIVGDYEFFYRNADSLEPIIRSENPLTIAPGGVSATTRVIQENIALRKSMSPSIPIARIYFLAAREYLSILRQRVFTLSK